MTALTKADIAELLYNELGLNKREAKELVEHFFEEIRKALARRVELKSGGYLIVDQTEALTTIDVKTGEEIPIVARRVVTFKPGQKLKARVEHHAGSQ